MPPPRKFFRFLSSKWQLGKFWYVLGTNFVVFELSYTHKPVSLDVGL